jgi:NADH:ubiquinone oxidoreductase subunit H
VILVIIQMSRIGFLQPFLDVLKLIIKELILTFTVSLISCVIIPSSKNSFLTEILFEGHFIHK